MYNQSFHTNAYAGSTPNHDNPLRSDSQQPAQHGTYSQYRGTSQRTFQPTGMVQSFYGQQNQTMGYGQQQNPQAFHTASYRGNQPGHDQSWRGDAQNPSQGAYRNVGSSFSSYGMNTAAGSFGSSSMGQAQYGMNPSFQSYHTANYHGNQPGHDASLRGDSQHPAQSGFRSSFGTGSPFGGSQMGVGMGAAAPIQAASQFQSQFQNQMNNSMQNQFSSPQAYHLAHYKGNQPNHDQSLHADAQSPGQSAYSRTGF